MLETYLPIIITFMIIMTSVNFLPSTLTSYRERGVLRRMFTTPVTPQALLAAEVAITFGAQIVTGLLIVILAVGAFTASIGAPLAFIVSFLLLAAAASTLGLLVASVSFTAKAANALGAVLFFVLMFFSGLWLPRAEMPKLAPRHQRRHPDRLRGPGGAERRGRPLGLRAVLRGAGGLDRGLRRAGYPVLPLGMTGLSAASTEGSHRRTTDMSTQLPPRLAAGAGALGRTPARRAGAAAGEVRGAGPVRPPGHPHDPVPADPEPVGGRRRPDRGPGGGHGRLGALVGDSAPELAQPGRC